MVNLIHRPTNGYITEYINHPNKIQKMDDFNFEFSKDEYVEALSKRVSELIGLDLPFVVITFSHLKIDRYCDDDYVVRSTPMDSCIKDTFHFTEKNYSILFITAFDKEFGEELPASEVEKAIMKKSQERREIEEVLTTNIGLFSSVAKIVGSYLTPFRSSP